MAGAKSINCGNSLGNFLNGVWQGLDMSVRSARPVAVYGGLWAILMVLGSAAFADVTLAGKAQPAVSARLERSLVDQSRAILTVELELPPGATTNSVHKKPGVTGETRLDLSETTDVTAVGAVDETPAPKSVTDPQTGETLTKHTGTVRFTQELRLTGKAPQVGGSIRFIYCHKGSCQRLTESFAAKLDTAATRTSAVALLADEPAGKAGETDLLDPPVDLPGPKGSLDLNKLDLGKGLKIGASGADEIARPATSAKPDVRAELHPLEGSNDTVVLQVIVECPPDHYTYSQNKKVNKKPTRITVEETAGVTPAEELFSESPAATVYFEEAFNQNIEKHEGTVTFSRKYKVADASKLETVKMTGNVNLLMCKHGECTPFPKLPFTATYHATSVTMAAAPATDLKVNTASGSTLLSNLLLAFVGGIILNVMPCVLPVIGIKVVSFVEQSGENRWRIFALNWTYAAGSMLVFLILGTLAALFSMNSGQIFQSDAFLIVFGVVVFAMALSLLGVFELNLPGVATGFGLNNEKEGLIGAFISGVVATFLATPCIGPFMGPALGWSLGQSTPIIYAIWITLGLGMSLPYLILGLAPGLVSWLPRPGMWMVRFKQFSGFLLLATVLFLIQPLERNGKSATAPTGNMPVVASADTAEPEVAATNGHKVEKPLTGVLIAFLGLGIGLWMIGNLYNHASSAGEKWKVRAAAMTVALPLMWYGTADHFGLRLLPNQELAWEPWTEQRMQEHLAEGHPLLIDFTADWCATCKFNEATALNRSGTKKFVEENKFIAMKADFTDESPEIKKWLTKFKMSGVPVYVIFPPGESREPIVFEGVVTQGMVLEKLTEALKRSKAAATAKKPAEPANVVGSF